MRTRWPTTRARSLIDCPSEQLSDGVHVHLHLHSVAQQLGNSVRPLDGTRPACWWPLAVDSALAWHRLSRRSWRPQAARSIMCARRSMCNAAKQVTQQASNKCVSPCDPGRARHLNCRCNETAVSAKRPQQTIPGARPFFVGSGVGSLHPRPLFAVCMQCAVGLYTRRTTPSSVRMPAPRRSAAC
jgi:hypothetical protein